MLSQFSVSNFRSIKDTITLDMQATNITELEDKLIPSQLDEKLLPLAVIYGPNGGGKSNVLQAMGALLGKVIVPIELTINASQGNKRHYSDQDIVPFAFDRKMKSEPTCFEIYFQAELAEYCYELKLLNDEVVFESLRRLKYSTKRPSKLFTRTNETTNLMGDFKEIKISDALSSNLPLLSYLAITNLKNPIIKDVIDWFRSKIMFVNCGNPIQELQIAISRSESVKKLVLEMLKEMNVDIVDFRTEERPDNAIEVFTKHRIGDDYIELTLRDESSGTKKLFGLLPVIATSLLNGGVLIIDELDAKLHPMLLKYILGLYNDPQINQKHSQLIFTSHDLTTMNNEVFRRDEIWFVAKGEEQNSNLYSLADFKAVRKDAQYAKQYLEGKYGADSNLKNFIKWCDYWRE